MAKKRPRWGFWKCFHRLRLDGQPWNHKRVYRIYKELGLNYQRRTKSGCLCARGCPWKYRPARTQSGRSTSCTTLCTRGAGSGRSTSSTKACARCWGSRSIRR
ncbi:MAG: transposase [bacterium]|nr:transposase [bacterium]